MKIEHILTKEHVECFNNIKEGVDVFYKESGRIDSPSFLLFMKNKDKPLGLPIGEYSHLLNSRGGKLLLTALIKERIRQLREEENLDTYAVGMLTEIYLKKLPVDTSKKELEEIKSKSLADDSTRTEALMCSIQTKHGTYVSIRELIESEDGSFVVNPEEDISYFPKGTENLKVNTFNFF